MMPRQAAFAGDTALWTLEVYSHTHTVSQSGGCTSLIGTFCTNLQVVFIYPYKMVACKLSPMIRHNRSLDDLGC